MSNPTVNVTRNLKLVEHPHRRASAQGPFIHTVPFAGSKFEAALRRRAQEKG